MLVKDLRKLLYRYDDDQLVCVGIDFQGTPIDKICLANVDDGSIQSEEYDDDFDKSNSVVLIKGLS